MFSWPARSPAPQPTDQANAADHRARQLTAAAPAAIAAFLSLDWLLPRSCPLCRRLPSLAEAGGTATGLCSACSTRLALPAEGLHGQAPLSWWSSGSYNGGLRRTLLNQKCGRPDPALIRSLLQPLLNALKQLDWPRGQRAAVLVPIPGWKQRANPLPGLIADQLARELGLRRADLLARSHPVLGQHHLGQRLRQANQQGSFQLRPEALQRRPVPLLLVDDILTTGSTLRHAAHCLKQAGWPVLGAACLARTPDRRDWLRTP